MDFNRVQTNASKFELLGEKAAPVGSVGSVSVTSGVGASGGAE